MIAQHHEGKMEEERHLRAGGRARFLSGGRSLSSGRLVEVVEEGEEEEETPSVVGSRRGTFSCVRFEDEWGEWGLSSISRCCEG